MVGRKLVTKALFAIGLICCTYPLASNAIESFYQKNAVATYQDSISNSNKEDLEAEYKKSEEYNESLYTYNKGTALGSTSLEILGEESYENILNVGNGIMGSIEIPKISVNLPIYHGTSDDVLSVGVGHVYGSSLPVGGINTRSVLSGHRGLPNAKLFTRLDELVEGDLFFIRVLNNTLAYKVSDIKVIEPDDIDAINVVEGKDLVSLVTCTPYGLNTHRLVVTGERVPYEPEVHESIKHKAMSSREILFASIPFIFCGVLLATKIKDNINKKKGDK